MGNLINKVNSSEGSDIFEKQFHLRVDHNTYALDCSPDSEHIAYSDWTLIRIYDMRLKNYGPILEGHKQSIQVLKYSPDAQFLASASGEILSNDLLLIWDLTTKLFYELSGHQYQVKSLQFSANGMHLISGSIDRTIRIWDWKQKTQVAVYNFKDWIRVVDYSPKAQYIVFAYFDDQYIQIVKANNGKRIMRINGHKNSIWSIQYSKDQNLLVSGSKDKTLRLWTTKQVLKLIRTLQGHEHIVASVSFSTDSNQIVSSAQDQTVRLWSTSTGQELGKIETKDLLGSVDIAQISRNGKNIITGGFGCLITPINQILHKI